MLNYFFATGKSYKDYLDFFQVKHNYIEAVLRICKKWNFSSIVLLGYWAKKASFSSNCLKYMYICRCTQWGVRGLGKHGGPQAYFKRLVYKNEIKPKIGGPPPQTIFPENLDHLPRDFGKNLNYTPPGFSTRVHLCKRTKWNEIFFSLIRPCNH